MAAKSEAELAQEFAQTTLSATPVLVLGSGASAAHGVPGMAALAMHLTLQSPPADWTTAENQEWISFLAHLRSGADLENALQEVRPTERQTRFIAVSTRLFLLSSDIAVLRAVLSDRRTLPLSRLYRHLFDSTHTTIQVVTPNYDRIAEYAADAAEFATFVGFSGGYLQTMSRGQRPRASMDSRQSRTVEIWKVHGSLDWFEDNSGQAVSVKGAFEVPDSFSPLMITPGLDKYRLTHGEPFRTIIGCSDKALESARAYFCIGYGFNDSHVQTKLIERCNRDSVPLVVITKELTGAAKKFLVGGRCHRYLAIEENSAGARIYMHSVPGGFDVPQALWRLDKFLDHMIGTQE